MILTSVHVKNFRSIVDETLDCEMLTALVGPNGAGKSSFLKALELFYAPVPHFDELDFYNGNTGDPIQIEVTFGRLTPLEQEKFGKYVDEDSLTVVRILPGSGAKNTRYHGSKLQNPEFKAVREAGGANDVRRAYKALTERPEYADLPNSPKTQVAVLQELERYEGAHPEACARLIDDGQFFGFTEVAQGYLGASTRFIFIPAVRDALEDAEEGRNSAISQLMDLLVRNALAVRPEINTFQNEIGARYRELIDPTINAELKALSDRLTKTLNTFVRDASVDIGWGPAADLQFPMPRARVRLVEDGYPAAVNRTGHGLQRAFILTMLQHLTVARDTGKPDSQPETANAGFDNQDHPMPNLILGIEEPEVYQHPTRQRHLASVLHHLASGALPGVAASTQIIYATHSPMFVGIDRFEQIRLIRKMRNDDGPKKTQVSRTTLASVADELWQADGQVGQRYTAESLRPRLDAVMTPFVNEGFFAERAVLVEGEEDRAAILGTAQSLGVDLEAAGIAVIPCLGKCNLDRPTVIFRQLGIPVYVLWDSDRGASEDTRIVNHRLMRLMGRALEDWPNFVSEDCACFERTLGSTLKDELGAADYELWLEDEKRAAGIRKNNEAEKRPLIVMHIMQKAAAAGRASPTLRAVVFHLAALPRPAQRVRAAGGIQSDA